MNPDKIKAEALGEESIKQRVSKRFNNLLEKRTYIDDPSEAPPNVDVHEGERGGYYYEYSSSPGSSVDESDYDSDDDDFSEPDEGYNMDDELPDGQSVREASQTLAQQTVDRMSNDMVDGRNDYSEAEDEMRERAEEAADELEIADDVRQQFISETLETFEMEYADRFKAKASGEESIKQRVSEKFERMFKNRIYVQTRDEAPDYADVQESDNGNLYYEPDSSDAIGTEEVMSHFEDYIDDIDITDPQDEREREAAQLWSDFTRDVIDEDEFESEVADFIEEYAEDTLG